MLHKARVLTAEIGQSLGLYTLGLHAVRCTPELIPLLAYNTATQQVTAVHRNVLELIAAPDTYLLQHIVNAKQEHRLGLEGRGNVDDGAVMRSSHYSGDSEVTGIICSARVPAHLGSRCLSAELHPDDGGYPAPVGCRLAPQVPATLPARVQLDPRRWRRHVTTSD